MTETCIELTDEQRAAVDTLASLRHDVATLGGLAGVGKTTIIRSLLNMLPGFAVCAFTGKAANVLRRKGVEQASTIHSLIYKPVSSCPRCYEMCLEFVNPNHRVGYKYSCYNCGYQGNECNDDVKFVKRSKHELFVKGIIVDEASMVGRQVYEDLLTFDVPLIFVGDHGQLEPVGSDDFNLMGNPQIVLETIHRNAGEIAHFASHLRNGGLASDWQCNPDGKVSIITVEQLSKSDTITDAEQIICAFNKTRVQLNTSVRQYLGRPDNRPMVGDRVICLQNSREHGVFNGMMGVVDFINEYSLRVIDDVGVATKKIPYSKLAFGSEKKPPFNREKVPFDFGYCITAHKAQGDEWSSVLVLEQRCDLWSSTRWNYTAASRAKTKLTWVLQS